MARTVIFTLFEKPSRLCGRSFYIETVSLSAIRSKVAYLLNKYKKNNKHKNPNHLPPDYEKVVDLKDPSFNFFNKEDKILYEQQLKNHSGYATNEVEEFNLHPSKLRRINQNASFDNFEQCDSDFGDSGDSSYSINHSPPKRVNHKAFFVGQSANKTQISCRKANAFLCAIDKSASTDITK